MTNRHLIYFPCLIVLLLSVLGGVILERQLTQWSQSYIKHELNEVAKVSAEILQKKITSKQVESFTISDWDNFVDGLPFNNPSQRITLIANDGKVLGDSKLTKFEIKATDNHLQRPEVSQAFNLGSGNSIRFSNTLKTNLVYVAVAFEHNEFKAVLRTASPENQSDHLINDVKFIVLSTAGAGMILIIVALIFSASYIFTFIEKQRKSQEDVISVRTREIELLGKFASLLAACNSLAEARNVVNDLVPRIVGPINGAVALLRSSRNQLEVKFDFGGNWPGANIYSPDECWALRKGKAHQGSDKYAKLPCSHMHESTEADNCLCVPLVAHGNTIGIIHWLIENEITEEQEKLIFAIAEHLGMALANLSLQEKLRDQAFRDSLTGLYNRRFFMDKLETAMVKAHREKQELTLLMLDLDHFKRFNDNFGHDAGDYVLKSLASQLSNHIRTDDILCRLGGEEFAIILPNTNQENGLDIAEKLCEVVRNLHLNFQNYALGRLTISIGLTSYTTDITKVQAIMKNADIALYQAKEVGRDQCCIYVPPKPVGLAKTV